MSGNPSGENQKTPSGNPCRMSGHPLGQCLVRARAGCRRIWSPLGHRCRRVWSGLSASPEACLVNPRATPARSLAQSSARFPERFCQHFLGGLVGNPKAESGRNVAIPAGENRARFRPLGRPAPSLLPPCRCAGKTCFRNPSKYAIS